MSTVRPDTSTETATPLTDGCNNNRLVKFSAFNSLFLLSVSVLQDIIKTKRLGR